MTMKLLVEKSRAPHGEITVPGDKSITHRSLILSSIAEGKSIIINPSHGADCMSTMRAMMKLGAVIDCSQSEHELVVLGKGLRGLVEPDSVIDCGNSGTTIRLLTGLLAGQDFHSVLTGDSSLRKRPMDRVVRPLSKMGARITGRANGRYAPLSIDGRKLKAITYKMPVASAQVKSAILIAGLYGQGMTAIEETVPTRDHTERMLQLYGCSILREETRITMSANHSLHLDPRELHIPGDISSAAFFMIWAAIADPAGKGICLKNVGVNPYRTGIIEVMQRMGADFTVACQNSVSNEPVADLIIKPARLSSVHVGGDMIPKIIDELPAFAVAATQAHGISTVRNAGELKIKETDRIRAIVEGLTKMGARIEARDDGFVIEGPTPLHGAECDSYDDHRIAMALTVAGLVAEGATTINGTECIAISFPDFVSKIRELTEARSIRIED